MKTMIVAGIIYNQDKTEIYITKRKEDAHQGGLWEFPGGKLEQGETIEQALFRELKEEINIEVGNSSVFSEFEYEYPDKSLYFYFIEVLSFQGIPQGMEGQQGQWVKLSDIMQYAFPEANKGIQHRLFENSLFENHLLESAKKK